MPRPVIVDSATESDGSSSEYESKYGDSQERTTRVWPPVCKSVTSSDEDSDGHLDGFVTKNTQSDSSDDSDDDNSDDGQIEKSERCQTKDSNSNIVKKSVPDVQTNAKTPRKSPSAENCNEQKKKLTNSKKSKKPIFDPWDEDDSIFNISLANVTSNNSSGKLEFNSEGAKKEKVKKPALENDNDGITILEQTPEIVPKVKETKEIPSKKTTIGAKKASPSQPFDPFDMDDSIFDFSSTALAEKPTPAVEPVNHGTKNNVDGNHDDMMMIMMMGDDEKVVTKKVEKGETNLGKSINQAPVYESSDNNLMEDTPSPAAAIELPKTISKKTLSKSPKKQSFSLYDMDDDLFIFTDTPAVPRYIDDNNKLVQLPQRSQPPPQKSPSQSKQSYNHNIMTDAGDNDAEAQTSVKRKNPQSPKRAPSRIKSPFLMLSDHSDSDSAPIPVKKTPAKKSTTKKPSKTEGVEEEEEGASIDDWGNVNFNPSNVSWNPGEKVPYSAIASMFLLCEATTKRLEIICYVRNFFRSVIKLSPDQLLPVVYLCVNEIAPAYEGKEMGIGNGLLERAVSEALGLTPQQLKTKLKEIGDIGITAQTIRAKQGTLLRPKKLYCIDVFNELRQVPSITGSGSQEAKRGVIKKLIANAVDEEVRYITRAFSGQLRIRLALLTILRCLGEAVVMTPPNYRENRKQSQNIDLNSLDDENNTEFFDNMDPESDDDDSDGDDSDSKSSSNKSAKKAKVIVPKSPWVQKLALAHKIVESAYNEGPSFDRLIPALLEYPLKQLKNQCMLQAGLPIKVMLGKPGSGVQMAVDKLTPESNNPEYKKLTAEQRKDFLTWEYKYDGERAQVHMLDDGTIQVYSRHMENYTSKYPDVIENVPSVINQPGKTRTMSFILDAEIVAWDPVKKRILPFQKLTTRKRKDADINEIQVKVQIYPFDILYINGRSLMKTTFAERREILHKHFSEKDGVLQYAQFVNGNEDDNISTFLQNAIEDSCEGLMVKPLYTKSSYYVPDKRKWIKIKKDYMEGAGDTMDLIILGAMYGKGKRTGVYGTYFFYSYDKREECYYSCTRIGTGYSDEMLQILTDKLNQHIIDSPPPEYVYNTSSTSNIPDVWFAPTVVAEVKCADLTASPEYFNAYGQATDKDGNECGIGMRFPRFLRLREDKPVTEATSPHQIAEMYRNQSYIHHD